MAKKEIVRTFTNFPFFLALLIGFILNSPQANAAPQNYNGLSADLPTAWVCQREGDDFICLNNEDEGQKSSAIVITVRPKGPEDNLTFFKDQLSRPKTIEIQGLPILSQVRSVKEVQLNGHTWVEGIHFGSEVQGFVTHYFVSTDGVLSALVSINVHQDDYNKIMPVLGGFVQSFKLLSQPAQSQGGVPISAVENEFGRPQANAPGMIDIMGFKIRKMFLLFGVGAIVLLVLLGVAIKS